MLGHDGGGIMAGQADALRDLVFQPTALNDPSNDECVLPVVAG